LFGNLPKTGVLGESKLAQGSREKVTQAQLKHPVYVKALPLRDLADLERIKLEILNGHVLIVKISHIAKRSIHETKVAINMLAEFVRSQNGDIGRLGEERIVITPASLRIWRRSEPIGIPAGGEAEYVRPSEEVH